MPTLDLDSFLDDEAQHRRPAAFVTHRMRGRDRPSTAEHAPTPAWHWAGVAGFVQFGTVRRASDRLTEH